MGATPHNREAVANGTPVWEWGRFSWGPLHHAGSTPFKKGVVGWFATSPEFNDSTRASITAAFRVIHNRTADRGPRHPLPCIKL